MGLVGLTQTDLGLDKTWVCCSCLSVVAERGLSCSERDGVLVIGSSSRVLGCFVELQEMLSFLVRDCLKEEGFEKRLCFFVSEYWGLKQTSMDVERTVAMRNEEREVLV